MAEALAQITRAEGLGMVTIRADLGRAGDAIARASGLAIPAPTRFVADGARMLGWMSPDEVLLVLPAAQVAGAVAALNDALAGEHALVADVSDMRAVFDITGPRAGQVLAKLSPTDVARLAPDALRRTRAAQVALAFWRHGGGWRLVGFRSVADYLAVILGNAATPGSDLDPR